jgi:cholest-4-en-3-one 26-monooxygenase
VSDVDVTDLELYRQGFPHDVFAALRRDAPVHWQRFPDGLPGRHDEGFWVLSKHEDVQAANRDTELFSALDGPQLRLEPGLRGTMLVSMDGREHTRLRRLISAGFTPRMVSRLDEQARRWAASIVDRALERGTCDFVRDVAYQLPMHMIADIVGIPLDDRAHVFSLTSDFLAGSTREEGVSADAYGPVQVQLFEYAQQLGRAKRSDPQDDVWTILSNVEVGGEDGERTALREIELDLFFMLLTVAGSETTRDAISLGLLALLEHPDQLEVLRREPDAMRPAVEEILRWASPVSYFARRAIRDTEIRGVSIAAGDRVTLWYASANRDEDVFDDPFRFDIRRTPNPHVAFGGGGPHFCLGANLARREITILFEELLARTHDIEAIEAPTYTALGIDNPILVAVNTLPVRLA